MFAQCSEGNIIKNLTLRGSQFTFTNVNKIENFFIVVETPLSQELYLRQEDLLLSEILVNEILQKFITLYPMEIFNSSQIENMVFNEIQDWAAARVKKFEEIRERKLISDPVWLAKFKYSEKIFTSILNSTCLFVLKELENNFNFFFEIKKFQATIESINPHTLIHIKELEGDSVINGLSNLNNNNIFLVDKSTLNKYQNFSCTIIDLREHQVIKGPIANTLSKKIVEYLKKNEYQDRTLILEYLKSIFENKINIVLPSELNKAKLEQTKFLCKLCNTIITFQINDKFTYVSKSGHKQVLGMKLNTYLLSHVFKNEIHYNSVLIDDKGEFFGYIESYSVLLKKPDTNIQEINLDIQIIENEEKNTFKHNYIEILMIINKSENWIYEVLKPNGFITQEFHKILSDKMEKYAKNNSLVTSSFKLDIGDKIYHIWQNSFIILCVSFTKEIYFPNFDNIANEIITNGIKKGEIKYKGNKMNLAFKYLEQSTFSIDDIKVGIKILFDDILFSKINVDDEKRLSQIIRRVKKEFKFEKEILDQLFLGKVTIFELINGALIQDANEILKLVEFLEMRNVFSKN